MPPEEGDEALEVQLLEDDLRRIQALAGPGSDDLALAGLVARGLERFQCDEAAWRALAGRNDPAAPAERDELKRRETVAFLISMRARTIVSEMRMEALGRRAQVLERRHAERLRESAQMRRAIETLGRRIARLEAALRGGPPAPAHRPSLAARVARFLGRRHG
jgi:hypothetical protein